MSDALPEIIVPAFIYRDYIQKHREYIFLYGNDINDFGRRGCAYQFSCEPNSYYIPVRFNVKSCRSEYFFSDYVFDRTKSLIDNAIRRISKNNIYICSPHIGMGAAQLQTRAPLTLKYIQDELKKIVYPNIRWDYL